MPKIEDPCDEQQQQHAIRVVKFMLLTKPRNKCCPITLNPLGKFSPYFLLFESDQLYVFEAAPLARSCMENGAFSPITRRRLNLIELRRLARATSCTIEELQSVKSPEDGQAGLVSFLSEDVGALLNDMSSALSSESSIIAYWEYNQSRILQGIANLCQVTMATAREVIETHIRRTELLCCRNARWVSNNAARFFLSELYHLRRMTLVRTQEADRDMISIAMRNIRLNSVRTRQTQVESQLSEYMNTHVPENVTHIRHNQQVDENQGGENQGDENQGDENQGDENQVAQRRTNDVVNFTTLNDVLLTRAILNMMENRTIPPLQDNRRRRRYSFQDGPDTDDN